MNTPPNQTPPESPKTVAIGCLIVFIAFGIVGGIMHFSDQSSLPEPTATVAPTTPSPDASISPDRAAIQQFASDEGKSIHQITGRLKQMEQLMDPPEFGNDLWLSNVKDICDDMEIETSQGMKIDTPHQCRPVQQEYVLYLNDVRYYAHWLPGSIKAFERSGDMTAINACNKHLAQATRELNKARDAAATLNVQLETSN